MKQFVFLALLALIAATGAACSDDGFIKVFECNPTYPYFNVVDNHCYTSEEAAAAANDKAEQGDNSDGSGDKTDQDGNSDGSGDKTDQDGNSDGSGDKTDQDGNSDGSGDKTDQGE